MGDEATEPRLEELSTAECLRHLRRGRVGRIAFVVASHHPLILPVNYRLVETPHTTWIALRARPGGQIDRAAMEVAFEIDGIDPARREGWSVLVRGMLQPVDPDAADFREHYDSDPWVGGRDAWYVIEPSSITGRQLHPGAPAWAFHAAAYL